MSEVINLEIACPDCGSKFIKRPTNFNFDNNFTKLICCECHLDITKDELIEAFEEISDSSREDINDMLRHSFRKAQLNIT